MCKIGLPVTESKFIDDFPSDRCFKRPFGSEIISLKSKKNDFLKLFDEGMLHRSRCPLCAHQNTQFNQLVINDSRGVPCYVGECSQCGFVFSYKHLNEESLSLYYKSFSTQIRGIDMSSMDHRKKQFLLRAETFALERFNFLKKFIQDKKFVVEIGCNDGANLYPFFKNDYQVTGFDLDEDSLKVGQGFGLTLASGDCFTFLKENKVDVIILSHFVEHLIDPLFFLKKLYDHIDDQSIVYVEVPGIREPQWVNWKIGILPYIQFEHLQYFEKTSLMALLSKAGFACLESDEFVRGVFKKRNLPSEELKFKKLNGYQYLYNTEKKWQRSFVRKIYSALSSLKKWRLSN